MTTQLSVENITDRERAAAEDIGHFSFFSFLSFFKGKIVDILDLDF
jgi:hypothetical protein